MPTPVDGPRHFQTLSALALSALADAVSSIPQDTADRRRTVLQARSLGVEPDVIRLPAWLALGLDHRGYAAWVLVGDALRRTVRAVAGLEGGTTMVVVDSEDSTRWHVVATCPTASGAAWIVSGLRKGAQAS